MTKIPLRDLIVLLPGITGSVLQKDGQDIWNLSGQTVWKFISTHGNNLQALRLENTDPLDFDRRDDGIKATTVISNIHLIPGLYKTQGYSDLIQMILRNFDATLGNIHKANEQANFFPFPYDWRLDNRIAAHQLKSFLDRQLSLWRRFSYQKEPRVILIAHSMGGLVARYYLEVLEGWKDCRALITFGTPYRGSLDALGYLANGYKKKFLDLTHVLRTFPSVYQLLPIYQVVQQQEKCYRVAELDGIPNIERALAQEALTFHRSIENAVDAHRLDPKYLTQGYKIIPIVGTCQPTYQSGTLVQEQLILSRDLPEDIDPLLADGDGTVPRISAIPIELSEEYYNTFFPEQHGSLQSNAIMLDELYEWLKQMQIQQLKALRGPEPNPDAAAQPAISLDIDDLYVQGNESIELWARLINTPQSKGVLQADLQAIGNKSLPPITRQFRQEETGWVLLADDLPADLYRVTVSLTHGGLLAPSPVHDLFEIVQ